MIKYNLKRLIKAKTPGRKVAVRLPVIDPTNALKRSLLLLLLEPCRVWADAIKALSAAYAADMERLPAAYVRDDTSTYQGTINEVESAIARLLLVLTPSLRRWALQVESWHRVKWTQAILTPSGVDLSTVISAGDVTETLDAVVARNVALVKDISAQTQAKISDIVFRNFQARTPTAKVAKELREAVGFSQKRAMKVAIDQTVKLSAQLDTERMIQAGIDSWEWRHSEKKNFRPDHKARNGKVYTFKNPPPDMPGMLPYCGCKKQARIVLDD